MLGISSACFYPKNTEETVPLIAEIGYCRAEFFLNSHSEFSPAYLSELKKKCSAFGIIPVSVHPYTSFAEPNLFFSDYKRRFGDGLELYKRYFSSAAEFGAKFFNLHGAVSRQKSTVSPERYAERYSALRHAALAEGIDLCQENVVDHLCGESAYIRRLKEILGDEISFTLDLKQANRAGEDPLVFAEIMGKNLRLCHMNDFDPEHVCLLPGFGCYDIRAFAGRMKQIGYTGDYMTEVYSDNYSSFAEMKESKRRLETIFD